MASSYYYYSVLVFAAIISLTLVSPPPTFADTATTSSTCNSVSSLCGGDGNRSVYDLGRITVRQALSASVRFVTLINKLLSIRRSSLSLPAIRALEDCRFLAGLNMEFILSSFKTVSSTSRVLPALQADDVQTWLSAILTNQETCADGIRATASTWSVRKNITVPLAIDSKLYSLSLSLFTKGWVPRKKAGRKKPRDRHLIDSSNRLVQMLSDDGGKLRFNDSGDNDVRVSRMVTVSLNGTGDFFNISDAVAAAPNNTDGRSGYFLIYITAGLYEEYVTIPKNKPFLMMIGDGINQTIVSGNRSFIDGWTTFNSATFAVVAPNFVAVNITFRNTAGAIKHQAVAVRNGADLSAFYNCSFEAYQDTLYAHSLRQFYRECDIYGTVDFIFGNAAAVFQDCRIYPRQPMPNQFNAITAQGRTDINQNTGISIQNCLIGPADDLASSNYSVNTYLGRPWKEFSRTIYMQTFMNKVIHPAGWTPWSGDFALNTSYYAEFNNTGPGSETDARVDWLGYHQINATEASNFTASIFLLSEDWLPKTGVPFSAGFI